MDEKGSMIISRKMAIKIFQLATKMMVGRGVSVYDHGYKLAKEIRNYMKKKLRMKG